MLNWTLLKFPKKFPNLEVTKSSPYVNREGKLISDIHFSRVDVAEKNYIKSGKNIFTSDDVITAVNAQIQRDQTRRKRDRLPPINWKIFGITMRTERPATVDVCEVYGIQSTFGFTYLVKDHELWNHFDASRPFREGYKVDLEKAVRSRLRPSRARSLYQKKSKTIYKRPKKLFQQMRQQARWQKKIDKQKKDKQSA